MGAEPGLTEAALGDGATVLLMGQGDLWEDALVEALTRHGVFVEHVAADAVVTAAVAAAPDLIVLLGDATGEQSARILRELATAQTTSIVPVVLLARDDALDERLRAFRHGAVAVVPRSSSVDEMATRICSLIREIPERRGEAIGEMGEATLDEFVDVVSRELRSGILSVKSSQRDDTLVRMVLGKGRDVARIVDEFVSRVQPLVKSAEPVRYEFHEQAPGTLEQLDAGSPRREAREGDIRDMRIVLADDDPGRADEVAQALRAQGASVAVVRPDDIDVERVQHLDPEVIILGEEQAEAPGVDVLHRTRQHVRLRWARLLVVRWQDVWVGPTKVSTLSRLIERLVQLGEPERELRRRMASGQPFDTRIEITGPARMLRVLSTTNRPLRAISTSLRGRLVVDAAEGLIVGASGRSATEPALEGDKAIAAMLVLTSARVHVEPVSRPAVANLMATVDVALTRATSEIASLPNGWNTNPSIAPPRLTTRLTVASSAPAPVPVAERRAPGPSAAAHVPDPPAAASAAAHVPEPPAAASAAAHVPEPPAAAASAAARVPDPPPPRRAKTLIGLSPAVPPAPPPPPPQLRRPASRGLGSPPHPRPAPPARRPRVTPPAPPAATAASRAAADVVPTEPDDAIELEEISPANEGATHESEGATHESESATHESESATHERESATHERESATHESESATPANEGAAREVVPEPLPKAPEPLPIDEPPAAAPLPYVDHAQPAAPRRPAARPRAEVPWLGIGVGASVILVGIAVAVVIVIASRDDDDDDAVARPAVAAASVGAPPQTAPPSPVALPLGLEAPGTPSRPSAETASPRPPSSSSSVTATARAPRIELARTVTDEVAPDVGAASARARRQLARTLIARGDRSLRRGRLNRASAAYEEALRYAPRSDQAARGMAEARLRLSDHEGALRWARRLVELRPQGADSHMVLGDALLANGDRAGALDAWHTALRIHPRHRGVRYRLTRAARDR